MDGVETRVVEERGIEGGQVVEVARNYFAMCTETNSVFYFGEDVDMYAGGVLVSHNGTWLAGVGGARPGLVMPGVVTLGSRYFHEIAPDVAMDRAEVISLAEQVSTPAGNYAGVLMTKDYADRAEPPGIQILRRPHRADPGRRAQARGVRLHLNGT